MSKALRHSARVAMEKLIYSFFDTMDPTKTNTDFYKSFFSKMSDKEFDSFFEEFFKDENAYLTLSATEFANPVTQEAIEKTSKLLNEPLYEYVVFPFGSTDKGKPIVTPYPVPVGYIHEKRVQQTAIKKNSTSIDIEQRDPKTGQVVRHDKNSRNAIDENYAMMTYGAKAAIKEFMSFRADDAVMKEEAYSQIRQNGYVSMKNLPDHLENKAALNTLDAYLISMGIKTDLVTEGYLLPKTTQDE